MWDTNLYPLSQGTPMSRPTLRFTYDIVCPYAWMASTRVAAIAEKHGAQVEWDPILLGGVFRHLAAPAVPAATWAPTKAQLGRRDIHRMARVHGLSLRFPDAHPRRTVHAMRLCCLAPPSIRPQVSDALFRAYWVDGQDVSQREVVDAIAVSFGLRPDLIDSPATKAALFASTDAAAVRGVFGVPTLQVIGADGSVGPLHWGADRMHFVEAELAGKPVSPPLPPPALPANAECAHEVEVFHDFASPYSYLGVTQVARLAAQHGVRVRWRPILLGALFREIGTPNVPLFAMNEEKQKWYVAELDRWAAYHGVGFRFPSTFPVRTVLPLRVSLLAPSAILPLYEALWVHDRDIGQEAVVADVLTQLGLPADTLLAQAQEPTNKAALHENNRLAVDAGVCGVPSFWVDQRTLVWGQDRLWMLDSILAGWPADGETR